MHSQFISNGRLTQLGFALLVSINCGCQMIPERVFRSDSGEFKSSDFRLDDGTEHPPPIPSGPVIHSPELIEQETPKGTWSFDWPIDSAKLSRGFKLGKKPHWGLDLANRKGTLIFSAERGRVIYAGRAFRGYGKMIIVEHGTHWATLYAHLHKISVKEGQDVQRGQPIAEMGRTGRATGNHLHFELRYERQPVDPMMYLPQGFTNSVQP